MIKASDLQPETGTDMPEIIPGKAGKERGGTTMKLVILAENTVTETDARKALALLKLKMLLIKL